MKNSERIMMCDKYRELWYGGDKRGIIKFYRCAIKSRYSGQGWPGNDDPKP